MEAIGKSDVVILRAYLMRRKFKKLRRAYNGLKMGKVYLVNKYTKYDKFDYTEGKD